MSDSKLSFTFIDWQGQTIYGGFRHSTHYTVTYLLQHTDVPINITYIESARIDHD